MRYSTKTVGGTVEILAADNFTAIPICMKDSANIYKAGTPVTEDGEAALDGTGAVGILLYDVDTSINPNASIVVAGVVDYSKMVFKAGVTASTETLHEAIPAVYFRDNIGAAIDDDEEFTVDPDTVTVEKDDAEKVLPVNGTAPYTCESDDSSVATAAYEGGEIKITGVAAGDATITVTDANGKTATITVTVTA